MLQKILGAHPAIHTVSEPWIALHPIMALRENGIAGDYDPRSARSAVESFLRTLPEGQEAYYESLRRMLSYLYGRALEESRKSLFLDKTPRYYFIIPQLRRVFPRARIVFLLRNPLAILSSILETWVKCDEVAQLRHSRHDLTAAPTLILEGIQSVGSQTIIARYEDLVSTPETAVQHLCEALGITFYRGMIEYGTASTGDERWHFGDQGTVYRESCPVLERANRWTEVLKESAVWRGWARSYLEALGPDVIRGLGYDYGELNSSLGPAEHCLDWRTLMYPTSVESNEA
jgi:hypothetical protein